MKKYHFYVSPRFVGGYCVWERGRGNYFCVSYPTKYRAQIVAKALWRLWKNKSPVLDYNNIIRQILYHLFSFL